MSRGNSPIVVAPKLGNNGGYIKLRLCLDIRVLTALHVDIKYSLPLYKEIFNFTLLWECR